MSKKYIICGGSQGRAVIYGSVDQEPQPDQPVELRDARMILRWTGSRGLFGLAAHGPEEGSRITCRVPLVRDVCRQAIAVTPEAEAALDVWPDA